MTVNAVDEVIIGSGGKVWYGATTATAPTSALVGMLDTNQWTDLGIVAEDGVTFTDNRTIQDIEQWNGFLPVRKVVTKRDTTVAFKLRQWNTKNLILALGGGSFDGSFTYTPPTTTTISEWGLIVTWRDGTHDFLLYIARGMVSSSVSFSLVKDKNAELPVEFSVLGDPTGVEVAPYKLFTDSQIFTGGTGS